MNENGTWITTILCHKAVRANASNLKRALGEDISPKCDIDSLSPDLQVDATLVVLKHGVPYLTYPVSSWAIKLLCHFKGSLHSSHSSSFQQQQLPRAVLLFHVLTNRTPRGHKSCPTPTQGRLPSIAASLLRVLPMGPGVRHGRRYPLSILVVTGRSPTNLYTHGCLYNQGWTLLCQQDLLFWRDCDVPRCINQILVSACIDPFLLQERWARLKGVLDALRNLGKY